MRVFILTRKRLAFIGAALAIVCCMGIFRIAGSDTAVSASTTERNIPIYCVQTEEKKVSISFDAAWGDEQTHTLLDILDKYKVKSTFFLVGDWVRNYPDDVKDIAAAGHDIGNHSNTHPYMTQVDMGTMKSEIETCNEEIKNITGQTPTLFRAPYGDYDNNVVNTVNSLGMYCVQWDVDSLDWKNLTAEEMCSRIKNNIKCGSIILMHNGAENTPEALPMIIECIQEQGYEIVPISELLPKGEYTTDHTGMMIPKETKDSKSSDKNNSSNSSEQLCTDEEKTQTTAASVRTSQTTSENENTSSSSTSSTGTASDTISSEVPIVTESTLNALDELLSTDHKK